MIACKHSLCIFLTITVPILYRCARADLPQRVRAQGQTRRNYGAYITNDIFFVNDRDNDNFFG